MDHPQNHAAPRTTTQQQHSISLAKVFGVLGILFIIVALGLFYWNSVQLEKTAVIRAKQTQDGAVLVFEDAKLRAATLAKGLTTDVNGIDRNAALARQEQYAALWPYMNIVLFDKSGDVVRAKSSDASLNIDMLKRREFEAQIINAVDMVALRKTLKATTEMCQAYVQVKDRLYYVCMNKPTAGAVGEVAVCFPIDAIFLNQAKNLVRANFALLSLSQVNVLGHKDLQNPSVFSSTGSTLTQVAVPGVLSSVQQAFSAGEYTVTLQPLKNADGLAVMWLLAVPMISNKGLTLLTLSGCSLFLSLCSLIMAYIQRKKSLISPAARAMYRAGSSRSHSSRPPAQQGVNVSLAEVQEMLQRVPAEGTYNASANQQRLFDNAPIGFFQCTQEGKLVQVNQTFAAMLGYDSAVQMLTEADSLQTLCFYDGEAPIILCALKDNPSIRHGALLRLHGGNKRAFWLVSIASYSVDKTTIEGFLLDRTTEEKLTLAEQKCIRAIQTNTSLAFLLASTCKQSQHYFLKNEPTVKQLQTSSAAFAPTVAGGERRQGAASLKSMFEDIYEIALLAAEGHVAMATQCNLDDLLQHVKLQVMPPLNNKNVSFAYGVEEYANVGLMTCVPLLRHALLRLVLFVTETASSGVANINVTQDKEYGAISGAIRLHFAVSWENNAEREPFTQGYDDEDLAAKIEAQVLQGASAVSSVGISHLALSEEFRVIQFLAQQLHGDIIEGLDTSRSRSMYLSVTLGQRSGQEQPAQDMYTPSGEQAVTAVQVEEQTTATSTQDINFTRTVEPHSLDLLVMDDEILDDKIDVVATPYTVEPLDILLVEDSLNNRLLFSLYLRETPHRITEAGDGQEGVELFREKQFDVVFMDMEMPMLDGYQATRIIRAFEQEQERAPVPIVAQTAHVLPEFKNKCMLAGCSEFLPKPFSKHALLSMLATINKVAK